MPETGDEYPSRTLADRERSQDNRGSRKVARLRNGGAEESARAVQQNLASGLVSPLEYRVTQNFLLETKSGLLDAIYRHNVARAEWDRATGRYFQFSDDTAKSR